MGRGDPSRAVGLFERVVAMDRAAGDRDHEGIAIGNLGGMLRETGRMERAERAFLESLSRLRESGVKRRQVCTAERSFAA